MRLKTEGLRDHALVLLSLISRLFLQSCPMCLGLGFTLHLRPFCMLNQVNEETCGMDASTECLLLNSE